MQAELFGGFRNVPQLDVSYRRVGRVAKKSKLNGGGDQFMQQLELLRSKVRTHCRDPGDVASGLVKACDDAGFHGIDRNSEDHWNRCGSALRSQCGGRAPKDNQCGNALLHQLSGERWQPIIVAFCPAILDPNILAFSITCIGEALSKCRYSVLPESSRLAAEKPYDGCGLGTSKGRQQDGAASKH